MPGDAGLEGLRELDVEMLLLALVRAIALFLVGAGFALVYGTGRVLNLCHGSLYMLGAYLTYVLQSALNEGRGGAWAISLAIVMSSVMVGGSTWLLFRLLAFRSLQEFSPHRIMALSMGANLVLAELIQIWFGHGGHPVPPIISGKTAWGGASVSIHSLIVVMVGILCFAVLGWIMNRTPLGLRFRALGDDHRGAALVGIDVPGTVALAGGLGGALAGLAGGLMAPLRVLSPTMWIGALIESLAIVTLGGVGSLKGALLAASVIAALEVGALFLWSAEASHVIGLLVIFIGLMFHRTSP